MSKGFLACVKLAKQGKARVRRVVGPSKEHGLAAGEYVNYCYHGDKSYRGEVHKKEKK